MITLLPSFLLIYFLCLSYPQFYSLSGIFCWWTTCLSTSRETQTTFNCKLESLEWHYVLFPKLFHKRLGTVILNLKPVKIFRDNFHWWYACFLSWWNWSSYKVGTWESMWLHNTFKTVLTFLLSPCLECLCKNEKAVLQI